jgi:hypothetical protein
LSFRGELIVRRLWILFVLACVVGPAFALYIVYMAWAEPHPTVVNCASYLHQPLDGPKWLDLRDCTLDYRRAVRVYDKKKGKQDTDAYYVPVTPKIGDNFIMLFYRVSPKEAANMRSLEQEPPETLEAKLPALTLHRRIVGVVQDGNTVHSDVRAVLFRKAASDGMYYAAGWKTIDDDGPIPLWVAAICMLPLLGLGANALWRRFGDRTPRSSTDLRGAG